MKTREAEWLYLRTSTVLVWSAHKPACLILLLPLTPLFTSRKHFALYISKWHWLSTDTVNWHCRRFTYFSIVMFSTLILDHTFADACNLFCYYFYLLWLILYCRILFCHVLRPWDAYLFMYSRINNQSIKSKLDIQHQMLQVSLESFIVDTPIRS